MSPAVCDITVSSVRREVGRELKRNEAAMSATELKRYWMIDYDRYI